MMNEMPWWKTEADADANFKDGAEDHWRCLPPATDEYWYMLGYNSYDPA